jgi:RNA-directed DNA polymerase
LRKIKAIDLHGRAGVLTCSGTALLPRIVRKQVNWVLDADIRGFFDAMAHSWIIRFLEHRIAYKRILRLITKWLKIGTVEDGRRTRSVCGAPQGAVISPILANVYLHYVFDLWVHRRHLTKASGDMIVIRYADDTIVGFQHEHEARAFLDDLKERMRKFEWSFSFMKLSLASSRSICASITLVACLVVAIHGWWHPIT